MIKLVESSSTQTNYKKKKDYLPLTHGRGTVKKPYEESGVSFLSSSLSSSPTVADSSTNSFLYASNLVLMSNSQNKF